jgi:hypothetical protein
MVERPSFPAGHGGSIDMRERVTNQTGAATPGAVAESCPKAREFPEQLVVLVGLTALVLALAAWAHAVGPQDEIRSSRPVAVEMPLAR